MGNEWNRDGNRYDGRGHERGEMDRNEWGRTPERGRDSRSDSVPADRDYDSSFRSGADYGSYGRSDWESFSRGDERFAGGPSGRGRDISRETSYPQEYPRSQTPDWSRMDISSSGFNRDSQRNGPRDMQRDNRQDDRRNDRFNSYMRDQSGNRFDERTYGRQEVRNDFGRGYGSDTAFDERVAPRANVPRDNYPAYSAGLTAMDPRATNHAGRGPKNWKRSDERIRDEVSEALERSPEIDASEIEVAVKDGLVTLSGAVEHRLTKRLAEDLIERISGVRDIKNDLTVNQNLFNQARELITGERVMTDHDSSKASPRH